MGIFNFIYNSYKTSVNQEIFNAICRKNKIKLDYETNKNDIHILKEIFETRFYSDYFPFYEKATILDIGGHKGYFSIFSSLNLDEKSKIISLEPFEKSCNDLLTNLKSNNINNVILEKLGIYSETAKIDLYLNKSENNSIFKDYNSFLLNDKDTDIIKIDVITLEDIIQKHNLKQIDFLKMDCEGAEYPAILSTNKKTFDKIKVISMGFHDLKTKDYTGLKIVNHLEKNGFYIFRFAHYPTTINNNYGRIIAIKK